MTRFLDGPAAGVVLMLRRAPVYIRVVRGRQWDALDQLDDTPEPDELVTAYQRVGNAGTVHIDFTRKRSAWFATATYRVVPDQPPDRVVRSTYLWRAWCWATREETCRADAALS